jgi:hypothetical protein
MNSSRKSVEAIARVGLLLAVALGAAAGCGEDTPSGMTQTDAGTRDTAPAADAMADVYAPGGNIPPPPDGAEPPPLTLDANYVPESECCQVELSIADPTADETVARLVGDQAPLDVAGGVALTHSDGRWRASVCLPLHTLVKYRFHFGTKLVAPEIPPPPPDAGATDAGSVDAGVEAGTSGLRRVAFRGGIRAGEEDAGEEVDAFDPGPVVDGGAGQEEDAGDNKPDAGEGTDAVLDPGYSPDANTDAAEPDAPLMSVEDFRCSTDVPVELDAEGKGFNLFTPVISCNVADR